MYDKASRSHVSSAAASLTSVADIAPAFVCDRPALVNQIGIKVTTSITSSGAIVVSVYQRTAFGSATNQVLIGTITIPSTAVAGQIYVNNINDKTSPNLAVGDQITFSVTTAAAGGGAAGAGVPLCRIDDSEASDKDNSNIVVVTS